MQNSGMDNNRKSGLPVCAIILDVIGTMVLALGIFTQFGGDDLIFPEFLDAKALGVVLIFAGVLMMFPLIIVLVRRAISQN